MIIDGTITPVDYSLHRSDSIKSFGYSRRKHEIYICDDTLELLTPNEQIKSISDVLMHEFMHHLLYIEFNTLTCKLFDLVEANFVQYPKIEKKRLTGIIRITHKDYIEKYGLCDWCEQTHTDIEQIKNLRC